MKGQYRESSPGARNIENFTRATDGGIFRWRVRFGRYLTCRHKTEKDGWMKLFMVWDPAGELRMQTYDFGKWDRILIRDITSNAHLLREAILLGGLEDGEK